ncbi:hypothetical protein B0H10DRAFT_2444267 [Mycena sp. CBHHK59/15]|nr:hypothetical protein B0H10DRAFT_2444267 [Mycena sp. CBHHK59/15]
MTKQFHDDSDMHNALRLSSLNSLPISIRRVAIAAANGSLDDITRVQSLMKQLSDTQTNSLLAAFYRNLDTAGLPRAEDLDMPLPPLSVRTSIAAALRSLQAIYCIPQIPPDAGPEIWERVWPWHHFVYTYRDSLPWLDVPTEKKLCMDFFMFFGALQEHELTSKAISGTHGIRFMVGRAWTFLVQADDIKVCEVGYQDLCFFIRHLLHANPSNIGELIEGAGGCIEDLALLVIGSITFLRGRETAIPGASAFLFVILDLMTETDLMLLDENLSPNSVGPMCMALLPRGLVQLLASLAYDLCNTGRIPVRPAIISTCLTLLASIFTLPRGYRHLAEALQGGLLHAMVLCATLDFVSEVQRPLLILLNGVLPSLSNYHNVLSQLETVFPEVQGLADTETFEQSLISDDWSRFAVLAADRLEILESFNNGEFPDFRACDNLECGQIHEKPDFRRCAGCLSVYFCSRQCQIRDWKRGHRETCGRIRRLHLSERADDLSVRERGFLRALLHSDYEEANTTLPLQKVAFMAKNPGEAFYTLFDYTRGRVQIIVQAVKDALPAEHIEREDWLNMVSRMERSGGRMELDIMLLAARYWVVPLRASSSVFHDGLQDLAREFAPEVTGDPAVDDLVGRIGNLIDEKCTELVEIH